MRLKLESTNLCIMDIVLWIDFYKNGNNKNKCDAKGVQSV